MTFSLSENCQAILLLTAPLIVGKGTPSRDLLRPTEYKKLALHLRQYNFQPSDFLASDAMAVLQSCAAIFDKDRLEYLLSRGFLLSQALEYWRSRSIWVVSRADKDYPRRIKNRLREDAPAVLYGCGDASILDSGGLAVVGSRDVDESLLDYARFAGELAAKAGKTLISGGAKGVDSAAMDGAAACDGLVCNVMAENLARESLSRKNRDALLAGKLTLLSPYDPSAGFNVGHALSRNKFIYALSDIALVVNSDVERGGTWAGAIEQLRKLHFVPVYVRSTGRMGPGLDELAKEGALAWPDPVDVVKFNSLFPSTEKKVPVDATVGETLVSCDTVCVKADPVKQVREAPSLLQGLNKLGENEGDALPEVVISARFRDTSEKTHSDEIMSSALSLQAHDAVDMQEILFSTVKSLVQKILHQPKKATEIAAELDVSVAQVKSWLDRLVQQGIVEKQKKWSLYKLKDSDLF